MVQKRVPYQVIADDNAFVIQGGAGLQTPALFTDDGMAQALADQLNQMEVSSIHFYEVLEDLLFERYCAPLRMLSRQLPS